LHFLTIDDKFRLEYNVTTPEDAVKQQISQELHNILKTEYPGLDDERCVEDREQDLIDLPSQFTGKEEFIELLESAKGKVHELYLANLYVCRNHIVEFFHVAPRKKSDLDLEEQDEQNEDSNNNDDNDDNDDNDEKKKKKKKEKNVLKGNLSQNQLRKLQRKLLSLRDKNLDESQQLDDKIENRVGLRERIRRLFTFTRGPQNQLDEERIKREEIKNRARFEYFRRIDFLIHIVYNLLEAQLKLYTIESAEDEKYKKRIEDAKTFAEQKLLEKERLKIKQNENKKEERLKKIISKEIDKGRMLATYDERMDHLKNFDKLGKPCKLTKSTRESQQLICIDHTILTESMNMTKTKTKNNYFNIVEMDSIRSEPYGNHSFLFMSILKIYKKMQLRYNGTIIDIVDHNKNLFVLKIYKLTGIEELNLFWQEYVEKIITEIYSYLFRDFPSILNRLYCFYSFPRASESATTSRYFRPLLSPNKMTYVIHEISQHPLQNVNVDVKNKNTYIDLIIFRARYLGNHPLFEYFSEKCPEIINNNINNNNEKNKERYTKLQKFISLTYIYLFKQSPTTKQIQLYSDIFYYDTKKNGGNGSKDLYYKLILFMYFFQLIIKDIFTLHYVQIKKLHENPLHPIAFLNLSDTNVWIENKQYSPTFKLLHLDPIKSIKQNQHEIYRETYMLRHFLPWFIHNNILSVFDPNITFDEPELKGNLDSKSKEELKQLQLELNTREISEIYSNTFTQTAFIFNHKSTNNNNNIEEENQIKLLLEKEKNKTLGLFFEVNSKQFLKNKIKLNDRDKRKYNILDPKELYKQFNKVEKQRQEREQKKLSLV